MPNMREVIRPTPAGVNADPRPAGGVRRNEPPSRWCLGHVAA